MLLMMVMRISSRRADLRIFSLVSASVMKKVADLPGDATAAFLMFRFKFLSAVICSTRSYTRQTSTYQSEPCTRTAHRAVAVLLAVAARQRSAACLHQCDLPCSLQQQAVKCCRAHCCMLCMFWWQLFDGCGDVMKL